MPERTDSDQVMVLWGKILRSGIFTKSDIASAKSLLHSHIPFARFVANIVFAFRDRKRLLKTFTNECSQGFNQTKDYAHNLLFLLSKTTADFLQMPLIRRYVENAAKSPSAVCRENATVILAKLAATQDQAAITLLKKLTRDSAKAVRSNARILLNELTDDFPKLAI